MPSVRIADDLYQKVEIIVRARDTSIAEYLSRIIRPQVEAEWVAHQDVYEQVMQAIEAEKKATQKLMETIRQAEEQSGESGQGSAKKEPRRPRTKP